MKINSAHNRGQNSSVYRIWYLLIIIIVIVIDVTVIFVAFAFNSAHNRGQNSSVYRIWYMFIIIIIIIIIIDVTVIFAAFVFSHVIFPELFKFIAYLCNEVLISMCPSTSTVYV